MAFLALAAVAVLVLTDLSAMQMRLVLVLVAVGAAVILGAAVFGADAATRRERRLVGNPARDQEYTHRRLADLGLLITRGRQDLHGLSERIRSAEPLAPRRADTTSADTRDPFMYLAYEVQRAQNEAWNAVLDAATVETGGDTDQRVAVFVNLARRMQSLSHRAIQGLDELENQVEDPDLLKGLFKVDHLSTRMRRQAESLAVIGGAASRRQWSRPVTVYEVLRSAIAEVEHYNRVKVVPPVEGTLDGSAVADVIHLLAELVENATKFAPPHTQVLLRAETVTAGLAIEVEDRGLGIPRESQRQLNDLLCDLDRIDTEEMLQDGRIGLLVVSSLARRHNVEVRLQTNLYGGTQAIVVVPNALIGSEAQDNEPALQAAPEPVPALTAHVPTAAISGAVEGRLVEPSAAPSWSDHRPVTPPAPQAGRPSAGTALPDIEFASGPRPTLPKRHAQTNLVPELLNTPAPEHEDPCEQNPGLMAAFQRGMRSGRQADGPADSNN